MNRFFKYFQFNKMERKGFIALVLLILLINISLFAYRVCLPKEKIKHQLYVLKGYDIISAKDSSGDFIDKRTPIDYSYQTNHREKNIEYFDFDPNTLSEEEWIKLGMSNKQIQVIQNYLSKGGHFYKREDLKKIYSISDRDYSRLEPYIIITTPKEASKTPKPTILHETKKLVISMNTADTTEFKQLHGIGSVLAGRIVKFRDALGGFHSKSQLKEVYGIHEDLYVKIENYMELNDVEIKRINVNIVSGIELAKHPYISKKQAEAITVYRKEHGQFKSIDDLSQIKTLNHDFLRKIEPYLVF